MTFQLKPRTFFKTAPSPVIAVLPISAAASNSGALLGVVCEKGQVMAIELEDSSHSLFWTAKVELPHCKLVDFCHAAYDTKLNCVYLINNPCTDDCDHSLFQISLPRLPPHIPFSTSSHLMAVCFIAEKLLEKRRLESISTENSRRLLFACDSAFGSRNDVTIWKLPSNSTSRPVLTATIKLERFKPRHSACYFNSASSFFLALCEPKRNRILMLQSSAAKLDEIVSSNLESGPKTILIEVMAKDSSPTTNEKVFSVSRLGSLAVPSQLAFNSDGCLFATENYPSRARIQAFENSDGTWRSVWCSRNVGPVCYIVGCVQTRPDALASVVSLGEFGSQSLAIFEPLTTNEIASASLEQLTEENADQAKENQAEEIAEKPEENKTEENPCEENAEQAEVNQTKESTNPTEEKPM